MNRPVSLKALMRKLRAIPFPVSIGRYPQGQIIYINPAMQRLLGHDRVPTRYRGLTSVELGWWTHPMERGRLLAIFNATRRLDAEEAQLRTVDGRVLRTAVSMRLMNLCDQRHTIAAFAGDPREHQAMIRLLGECENPSGESVLSGGLEFRWQPGVPGLQVRGALAGLFDTGGQLRTVPWRTAARRFHLRDWRTLVAQAREALHNGITHSMAVRMRIEEDPYSLHQVALSASGGATSDAKGVSGRVEPVRNLAQAYGYDQDQAANLELARDTAGVSTWEVFADGSVIWDSATFVQYGYPPGTYERPESIFRRAFSREEHDRLQRWIQENFQRTDVPGIEFEIRREGAPSRWISARATQRLDALGQITSIKGINWDITALKQAQQHLEAQRLELARLSGQLFEQERALSRRLSHQLHDGLGQTLVAMSIQVNLLASQQGAPSQADPHLQRVAALSQQALREVRLALADIRPPVLADRGLAAALEQECRSLIDRFATQPVKFLFEPVGEGFRLDRDVEYALFMVAREAIINALKHAQLSTLRVSCRCSDGPSCTVYVQDDGVGMSRADAASRGSGVGLTSMRERAASVGARLSFLPVTEGTCLRVEWAG